MCRATLREWEIRNVYIIHKIYDKAIVIDMNEIKLYNNNIDCRSLLTFNGIETLKLPIKYFTAWNETQITTTLFCVTENVNIMGYVLLDWSERDQSICDGQLIYNVNIHARQEQSNAVDISNINLPQQNGMPYIPRIDEKIVYKKHGLKLNFDCGGCDKKVGFCCKTLVSLMSGDNKQLNVYFGKVPTKCKHYCNSCDESYDKSCEFPSVATRSWTQRSKAQNDEMARKAVRLDKNVHGKNKKNSYIETLGVKYPSVFEFGPANYVPSVLHDVIGPVAKVVVAARAVVQGEECSKDPNVQEIVQIKQKIDYYENELIVLKQISYLQKNNISAINESNDRDAAIDSINIESIEDRNAKLNQIKQDLIDCESIEEKNENHSKLVEEIIEELNIYSGQSDSSSHSISGVESVHNCHACVAGAFGNDNITYGPDHIPECKWYQPYSSTDNESIDRLDNNEYKNCHACVVEGFGNNNNSNIDHCSWCPKYVSDSYENDKIDNLVDVEMEDIDVLNNVDSVNDSLEYENGMNISSDNNVDDPNDSDYVRSDSENDSSVCVDEDHLDLFENNDVEVIAPDPDDSIEEQIEFVEKRLNLHRIELKKLEDECIKWDGLTKWNETLKDIGVQMITYRDADMSGPNVFKLLENSDKIVELVSEFDDSGKIGDILKYLFFFVKFIIHSVFHKNRVRYSDMFIYLLSFAIIMFDHLFHIFLQQCYPNKKIAPGHKIHFFYHILWWMDFYRFSPCWMDDQKSENIMKLLKKMFRMASYNLNKTKLKYLVHQINLYHYLKFDPTNSR